MTPEGIRKAKLTALGLCRACGSRNRKVAPGRTLCRQHLRMHAQKRKRKRNAKIEAGICVTDGCQSRRSRDTLRCVPCAAKQNAYMREFKRLWRAKRKGKQCESQPKCTKPNG